MTGKSERTSKENDHYKDSENMDEKQMEEQKLDEVEEGRRMAEEAEPYPITNIKELMDEDLPELKWIIEGLIPEGLAILVGKPKAGKSWFGLQLCFAVAEGKELFNGFPTTKRGVLYMALEDSKRRLKSRIEKQQGTIEAAAFYYSIDTQLFKKGGKDWLQRKLADYPEIKLVVIDTMTRFIQFGSTSKNEYEVSYNLLRQVQKIAREFHIAILLIHHMRKDSTSENPFDAILGSTGIAGVMDTMLAIRKVNNRIELIANGRDIEEQTYIIEFTKETYMWEMKGEAGQRGLSENRKKILDCFENGEGLTPMEISEKTEINHNTVKSLVRNMKVEDLLIQEEGKYKIKATDELSG